MPSERVKRRVDRLLDQAEEAADRRDWDQVRESARMVLRADPENADATVFLDMVEESLGKEPGSPQPAAQTSPVSAEQPSSFADGRYEVSRFLGEGGKKMVYLAHDTTLDRDVAFALIKTEGLDDTSRQRITREAQAMGRMGTHPHVMTIFDLGEENGQPFVVTEVMDGGDVEGLIDDAEDGRLSLEHALQIASETCRGLEFAHSKQIIHRDLKPGNVMLSADGTAKIGDFGLAISLDRSRLTQEKMMVGTVSYMPPEQATGGEITPRADLYSLGAMLYEMTTGRPPFMGDDEIAIIGQHINTPPVAPQWHRPEIPATLDSLIMRLLSKNPAERPDSAADVLSALEAIDTSQSGEAAILSRSKGGDDDASVSLDSMAGGVFVGRHSEMDQLKAALENALSGRGRMVTLVGEPGIGKTRTSLELETYAGLRNAQVLWGKCYEGGGAPPYWPWVQAIRSFVSSHEPQDVRSQMGSTASVIAEIVDDVKQSIPDIQPPAHIDDPESARFRLFDSIASFLKNAGNVQPIVLILDDLHWADKPSLMLLEFVARELSSSRVLIVGTYRDMELNRRHPLSVTLGDLTRERLFERVLLRGLTHDDVGRFIELAAGVKPPLGLVNAVHTQTEGNPLFVTETVRLLIQEGDFTEERTGDRDSWSVRIPEGVREVIGRRLDRLSERCNDALTIASVIGRQFTLDQLRVVVDDTTEGQLLDVIDEALLSRIIEELPEQVGLYQFTHALIEETLREELSLTRRVRLHSRVAEQLETMYGSESDAHAEELVRHFEQAQTVLGSEKLIHYALIAGQRALDAIAPAEAQRYFEIGLAAAEGRDMDESKAALIAGLAQAQVATLGRDRMQEAIDNIRRAFDAHLSLDERNKAIEIITIPMPSIHGPKGMADLLARALDTAQPETLEHARLSAEYGLWVSHERGEYEHAANTLQKALEVAQNLGENRLELRTIVNYQSVALWNLDQNSVMHLMPDALRLADELNDYDSEVTLRHGVGGTALQAGDLEIARDHAKKGIIAAEKTRNVFHWTTAMHLNAMVAANVGDWNSLRESALSGLERSPTEIRMLNMLLGLEVALGNNAAVEQIIRDHPESFNWDQNPRAALSAMIFAGNTLVGSEGDKHLDKIFARCSELYTSSDSELAAVMFAQTGLAKIAVTREDKEAAVDLFYSPRIPWSKMSNLPQLGTPGMLAALVGEIDWAIGHFEAKLEFARTSGYRPIAAGLAADYAAVLIDRDDPGDREKTTELQDEAIAIAQELGMKPLLERVLAQREILKA